MVIKFNLVQILMSVLVICFSINSIYSQENLEQSYSEIMANSIMVEHPTTYNEWDYVTGTVLKGFYELWRLTKNEVYFNYIKNTVDEVINDNGTIKGYDLESYNIDEINEGRMLLFLY